MKDIVYGGYVGFEDVRAIGKLGNQEISNRNLGDRILIASVRTHDGLVVVSLDEKLVYGQISSPR